MASNIDATFPVDGVAVAKSGERANWTAAKTEIERLQTLTVNVKDYGAVGNFSADDTSAINSAIAAVNTLTSTDYAVLYFPHAGGYKITAALTTLLPFVSVYMDAPMIFVGTPLSGFIWTIGSASTSNHDDGGIELEIWMSRAGSPDFSNSAFGAVRCYNLHHSRVTIKQIVGMNIGFRLEAASGNFCTGNTVYLGRMGCQYAVDLLASGTNSWIIQNSFHRGSIGHDAPTTIDKAGVRMQSTSGALPMHDLKFYELDIELGTSGTNRADAFATVGTVSCIARDLYLESNNGFLFSDGGGYCAATCISGAGAANQQTISEPTFSGSYCIGVEQEAGVWEVQGTGARTLGQKDVESQQRNNSGTATWTINKFTGRIYVDNVDGGIITLSAGTGVTLSTTTVAAGAIVTLFGRIDGTKVQVKT